ncbi:hypothetical protein ACWCPX_39765 [Streptomyces olivaceoviridis]
MAQISPRLARTYFAEIAADSALPLDPDDLVHMVRRRQHGHVVIGDIAIRCYKNRSRWTYDERDIRRAALPEAPGAAALRRLERQLATHRRPGAAR